MQKNSYLMFFIQYKKKFGAGRQKKCNLKIEEKKYSVFSQE
jgi:hypothetical protein